MDQEPKELNFVKAVSDPERLRVIGVLARQGATIRQVAEQLDMPFRTAFSHLGLLEHAGLVHKDGDIFRLDRDALESLSKQRFSRPRAAYVPAADLDAATRKVLKTYLNADGSLKQLPTQAARKQVILRHLAAAFEPRVDYTEKEVNTLLRRFHSDTATLRRDLVDAGYLAREGDGSRYWRTSKDTSK